MIVQVQIRDGVFETASSSVHSVVVHTHHANEGPLEPENGEDTISIPLMEFGWGPEHFDDLYTKLSYLLTFTKSTEYTLLLAKKVLDEQISEEEARDYEYRINKKLFESTRGFKQLDDIMFKYCGYHIQATDDDVYPGYVDHQSCEEYEDIDDFLESRNIELRKFLFDTGVEVWISNDNESDKRFSPLSAGHIETIDGASSYFDYDKGEYVSVSENNTAEFVADPDDDEGTDLSESGSSFLDEGTIAHDDYDKEADKYYDPTKGYASWNDLDEDVDFGDDEEDA